MLCWESRGAASTLLVTGHIPAGFTVQPKPKARKAAKDGPPRSAECPGLLKALLHGLAVTPTAAHAALASLSESSREGKQPGVGPGVPHPAYVSAPEEALH